MHENQFQEGEKAIQKELVPIGDRILGSIDPRTLSEEQFAQAPALVYHVSTGPLHFDKKINYATFQGRYSETVGSGLYCTDDPVAIARYVQSRSMENLPAEVTALLPYNAKMYDFRSADDPNKNGNIPKELFTEYRTYVIEQIKQKFPNGCPTGKTGERERAAYTDLSKYRSYLNGLLFRNTSEEFQPVGLRMMLGEGQVVVNETILDGISPEQGSVFFRSFMLEKGYNGIICQEGGDGWSEESSSFVFYTTSKVGTFQSWRDNEDESSSNHS